MALKRICMTEAERCPGALVTMYSFHHQPCQGCELHAIHPRSLAPRSTLCACPRIHLRVIGGWWVELGVHQRGLLVVRARTRRGFNAPSLHHKSTAKGVICRIFSPAKRAFLSGMAPGSHASRLRDAMHKLPLYGTGHAIVDFIGASTCFRILFTACIF